jgi:hypothetical protein
VTNAFCSDFEALELQSKLKGTDERFPRIAVRLPDGEDANELAHAIMRAIPDSGPVG